MRESARIIDISLPLTEDLPTWPGDPGFKLEQVQRLGVASCNETRLQLGSHNGTHIDAPRHFIAEGKTVEQIPLDVLVGEALVVECPGLKAISSHVLAQLDVPESVERLLIKTDNSALWQSKERTFYEDYAALTLDGAQWLVDRGVKLVGMDYLSVQRFHDSPMTHEALLGSGMVLLEGLDLSGVSAGKYELICLPLHVVGTEGAPARAILRCYDR